MLAATLVRPTIATGQTPTPSPAHVDHFMSYGTKLAKDAAAFVPIGPVSLPRLGGGPYDVLKVGGLLLPADKNGEGVRDDVTHLLEYRLKPSKGAPKFPGLAGVRVQNQCSDVLVTVGKPVAALVPTAKSLMGPPGAPADPPRDHFLCFAVKLDAKGPGGVKLPKFPKGAQVDVTDQFQSRRYELTKPTRLCVPTDKGGAPVFLKGAAKGLPAPLAPAITQHADEHLLCYKAKLATTQIAQGGCGPATPGDKGTKIVPKQAKHAPRTGVFVANQLGALELATTKEVELCVPSFADVPAASTTGLLPGDPQQLVSAATYDLAAAPGWTEAEISVDAAGARIVRTSLGIFFADDATVGAANAVLARIRATIVMMLAGPPYVVVRIPDPGSLDALQTLVAEIDADPAVASVSLDSLAEADILPAKFPLPTKALTGDETALYEERLGYIDHLLAARAAAAWNARGAIFTAPSMVIADRFGEGVPGPEIAADYLAPGDFEVGKPDLAEDGFPVRHGYQVLGVIAGAFDPPGAPADCFAAGAVPGPSTLGCATGIYPPTDRRPRLRIVDMQRYSWLQLEGQILLAVKELKPQRVVVNASIGRRAGWGSDGAAFAEGDRWRRLVNDGRDGDLEPQFLLIAAAGNVIPEAPNERSAMRNSSFTAAALHPNFFSSRLDNTLVVENRLANRFPFRPSGISPNSKQGGHISACGTDVWTAVAPRAGTSGWSGTSLAAPQVAGVAAYLLAIAPELSIEQVRELLIDYAQPGEPPALDAYATLVGVDAEVPGAFRVHRALLDFAASDPAAVNAADVSAFFAKYDLPVEQRRYSAHDLLAARDGTDPPAFDLNGDGKFETLGVAVGTRELSFNEAAMERDADVMCYAAFARTPYDDQMVRVDAGRERCCDYLKEGGRFPIGESCFDQCPTRSRARRLALEEEPQPLGAWRLSTANGLTIYDLFFLADGTVMILGQSGPWEKGGTWTSTPHEENGEILYYDVTVDVCPDAIQHTRYGFVGTWSPRPLTDCFGVTSCVDGDACPAMQGSLTTSDGRGFDTTVAVDSKRVTGIDGWAPIDPFLEQCHGACFEEWWRFGLLACTPVGANHCIGTAPPACGGVCAPGSTCGASGGECTCVAENP